MATVYYQFGSKTGLLEALCDDLAESGGMSELAQVFAEPDPDRALDRFIAAFARFWETGRSCAACGPWRPWTPRSVPS